MIKEIAGIFLLAAVANVGIAHALFRVPSQQEVAFEPVTSSRPAVRSLQLPSGNLLSSEGDAVVGRGPASAVQDWSSLWKQLCGAVVGEKLGISHSEEIPVLDVQQLSEDSSENRSGGEICTRILRKLQIGRSARAAVFSPEPEVKFTTADHKATHSDQTKVARDLRASETMQCDDDDGSPNWNMICVWLCRTGDGGSLCNCDLPLLMRGLSGGVMNNYE